MNSVYTVRLPETQVIDSGYPIRSYSNTLCKLTSNPRKSFWFWPLSQTQLFTFPRNFS